MQFLLGGQTCVVATVDEKGRPTTSLMTWVVARNPQTLTIAVDTRSRALRNLRQNGQIPFLRPDAKSQVTIEYNADGTPHRVHTVVLSTQHTREVMVCRDKTDYFTDDARQAVMDQLILPVLRREREDLIRGKLVMIRAPRL